MTLSKYAMKYLELVFGLINFETTILTLTLASQIFVVFLYHKILLLLLLFRQIWTLLYYQKICVIMLRLIGTNIFLKTHHSRFWSLLKADLMSIIISWKSIFFLVVKNQKNQLQVLHDMRNNIRKTTFLTYKTSNPIANGILFF